MVQPHRKDVNLPTRRGEWTQVVHPKGAPVTIDGDGTKHRAAARRTAIDLLEGPLAPFRDALTLIGGQAVMLRTVDRFGLDTDTDDADFAITPQLVTDTPTIEDQLVAAGFEPRSLSRPGLWGRGRFEEPGVGFAQWAEMLDLDCPMAFTGATSPTRHSVPVLAAHGKRTTGSGVGLELAAVDRGLLDVPDLMGSPRTTSMWVASQSGLLCAKGYKVGERIYESGGRRAPKPKDYLDLFLLLDSSDPVQVSAVFSHYGDDPVIGASVRHGVEVLGRLLRDPGVRSDLDDALSLAARVPAAVVDGMFAQWRQVFG